MCDLPNLTHADGRLNMIVIARADHKVQKKFGLVALPGLTPRLLSQLSPRRKPIGRPAGERGQGLLDQGFAIGRRQVIY